MQVKIKTIDNTVQIPKYQTKGSAGMDLHANRYNYPNNPSIDLHSSFEGHWEFNLSPNQRILIKTGLFMEIPEGYEAQIRPRSGLALKYGITIVNSPGTIDSDYRGEIGIILLNTGNEIFTIRKNDRIAQLVFNKVEQFELVTEDELSETKRNDAGFGSTNI